MKNFQTKPQHGIRIQLSYNFPKSIFDRLFKKWKYESGETLMEAFCTYVNHKWYCHLLGWKVEVIGTYTSVVSQDVEQRADTYLNSM